MPDIDPLTLDAGPELDAIVGAAIGATPPVRAIVTRDGGKSSAASENPYGTLQFRTADGVRAWLKEHHDRGLLIDYIMGEWKQWLHYSTDANEALKLPRLKRWDLLLRQPDAEDCSAMLDTARGIAEGFAQNPALAICRAVLRACRMEVGK